ncbi:MAG: glucose 1-dehydrogenase [Desulfobacteraceae bacterium]|nr:MAG: glucose 1-dehydrogenase [Desulfobacteraceae bacterium]
MGDRMDQFKLTGRVAVVTGASEGIGRAIALGLAEAGADVVVCSRRGEKLKEAKADIEKTGRKAELFVFDICKTSTIEELKRFIQNRFGKVDILVNNAGFTVSKSAWETTENDWDAVVDTGLKGLFFSCQMIGSIMREHGYGKIINLGSTFSRSIIPGRSVYAAVKAGVSHLTEALALEWASCGIRVNALAPTAVLTPSREHFLQGEVLKKILSRIPLGRLASPDDLVNATIYLASAASDFVTGHTLFVDGGWVAAS